MLKQPEYGIDAIVLIKYDGQYSWYLSDKTIWVMDQIAWGHFFSASVNELIPPERVNSPILDRNSWDIFKRDNQKFEMTDQELREMILHNLPMDLWDEKGEFFPTIFLDFDGLTMYSWYPESPKFEEFVTKGWTPIIGAFYHLIPQERKYWVIDGVEHIPSE